MWGDIAKHVIIFEDNSGTEAGGGETPQYLVVPRRWMEENLTTPEEQTPAPKPKEKENTSAATPAAKPTSKNWGPRGIRSNSSTLDEAAEMP